MDAALRDLADRIEIRELLTRYAWAIDTKDWALLDEVFVPDASLDYSSNPGGFAGAYPEVRAWLAQALAPFPVTQHFVTNIDVALDGDRATARSAVYNPMGAATRAGPPHFFFIGARYDDRLVRTSAGWRIAERVESVLWMHGDLPTELVVPGATA